MLEGIGRRIDREKVRREIRRRGLPIVKVSMLSATTLVFGALWGAGASAKATVSEPCSAPADAGWGPIEAGIFIREDTQEEVVITCGWGGAIPVVENELSSVFETGVKDWEEQILSWSEQFGLDPNLAATVMQVESCGDPTAVSGSGALGLFQVMPFHFTPGENPFDPDTNARRGLSYLARALELSGGDIGLTAAGYNGGLSTINRPKSEWAEETIRFHHWVEGIYNDATSGAGSSPTLQEWLQAGGVSLCR
jgi:hypothetical protein